MRRYTLCFGMASMLAGGVVSAEPITVYFIDRPPLTQKQADGTVVGSVAAPALRAFEAAKIPYVLKEASPARQVKEMKEKNRKICSLGWYKSAERESFAKFTKAVYQDTGVVGLANHNFRPTPNAGVEAALANPQTRVLTKDVMVYGPYLDAQFARMQAKRLTTSAEFSQMVRMVQAGRAEVTFLPQEEAIYYAQQAGFTEKDFNLIHFQGMPAGEKRYIMCSRAVEDETIAQLNVAIGDPKP